MNPLQKFKQNKGHITSADKEVFVSLLIASVIALGGGKLLETMRSIPAGDPNNLEQAAAIVATNNLRSSQPTPTPVTLGFVGDIMLDRGVRASVTKNLDGDYSKLFAKAGFLKDPDI